jgi:hypothetical protein
MKFIFNINKEESSKFGIYQIRNLENNKIYIGSTKNFLNRYKQHLKRLEKNTHVNKKLQYSYNKYDSFSFEIVEICDNLDVIFDRELYYINKAVCEENVELNKCKNLYNISKEIPSNSKSRHFINGRSREIVCFDIEGNLIKEYVSLTQAIEEFGYSNTSGITLCCQNKFISCQSKYVFQYKNDNYLIGQKRIDTLTKKYDIHYNVKFLDIFQFDIDFNLVKKYNSYNDIGKCFNNKKITGNIIRAIKLKQKCMNYYWTYNIEDIDLIKNKPSYTHSDITKEKIRDKKIKRDLLSKNNNTQQN